MNPNENSERGRSRGGRGRGRRGRPRVPAHDRGRGNAEAADSLIHVFLETLLHAKRQRRWEPSAGGNLAATAAEPPATDEAPSASTSWSLEPSTSWSAVHEDSTLLETCGGIDPSTPSTSRGPLHYQQPLRDNEIDFYGYGSEDEDDYKDSLDALDLSLPMSLPRTQRIFLEDAAPPAETLEAESLEPVASTSIEHEPRSMFDFVWRNFPNPPVLPTERREEFSESNCGPTAPLLTPYDAFTAIWSTDFMEYIVRETNMYAQQLVEKQLRDGTLGPNSRITHWRDTDVDELYVYFGLILATGMVVKGDLAEYWSSDEILSTPCFGRCMSVNRFMLLSRCLHFNENRTDILTMTSSEAKIYKIAPVVSHLNNKFQSLYRLGRNIAIDESLTHWKGWLDINQCIRNKAAKIGIKTYEVCEAQTGYLWRFKVHAEREEATGNEVTPVSGVIPSLVLELVKGLENKGHTVWMDHYYNSPALARVLKSLGFDCVGTLRTDRQYVPAQLAKLNKLDMAVGQISGCTSGDVDVLVWRDQNRVAMISTYHGDSVHTEGGKTKPTAVHDYNLCMGGVDKKDQMLSAYPLERKRNHIWYKKLFKRLLNTSVLNALILHRQSPAPDTGSCISKHRKFRLELIRELLSKHSVYNNTPRAPMGTSGWSSLRPIFTPDFTNHFPVQFGMTQYGSGKPERLRRTCALCHKRTYFKCPACDVALCLECTKAYHESK